MTRRRHKLAEAIGVDTGGGVDRECWWLVAVVDLLKTCKVNQLVTYVNNAVAEDLQAFA